MNSKENPCPNLESPNPLSPKGTGINLVLYIPIISCTTQNPKCEFALIAEQVFRHGIRVSYA
jgi:hypothetical protein|nr:MAG TPA: hypothetical protein [Caudoviricetes sp.]